MIRGCLADHEILREQLYHPLETVLDTVDDPASRDERFFAHASSISASCRINAMLE